jgi:5-methylcytosine-specific restriction endonuclease McrA
MSSLALTLRQDDRSISLIWGIAPRYASCRLYGDCATIPQQRQHLTMTRPTASQRGYGHRWQQARAGHLRSHPWCVMCLRQGLNTPATVVDHVQPHRGDRKLFWSRANWQSLCAPHHNSTKQATEHRGHSNEIGPDGLPLDPQHPFYRG